MAYFIYTLKSVPDDACFHAVRNAIWKPLYAAKFKSKISATLVSRLTEQTMDLWRYRVHQLEATGLPTFKEITARFSCNCPPVTAQFNVDYQGKVQSCQRHLICPWCWARRYVIQSWNLIQAQAPLQQLPIVADPNGLYVFDHVVREPQLDAPSLDLGNIARRLPAILRLTWKIFKQAGATACLSLGNVEPALIQEQKAWVITSRYLGLCIQDFRAQASDELRVEPLTRSNLGKALARFARYPAGMLRAPVERVIQALAAQKGQRLYGRHGSLHGNAGVHIPPQPTQPQTPNWIADPALWGSN
jgi:hypothetical protein